MSLNTPGIDYAWGRPNYDQLRRAGYKFAMRYISHDPAKDLSVGEKQWLFANKIAVGLVFETTAGRAKDGRDAGAQDAVFARARCRVLGLDDIPVYFAVDFDGSGPEVEGYFKGAVSVLGKDRVGVYAGVRVCEYLGGHGVCKWFWQTYAWSSGRVYSGTHIYQYSNGHTVAGVSCDLNRASDEGLKSLRDGSPAPAPQPTGHTSAWRRARLKLRERQLAATRKRIADDTKHATWLQGRIDTLKKDLKP
jgi:hypothetical protein